MKISILTPSRERPHRLKKHVESICNTSINDVEIVIGIDKDDPTIRQYYDIYNVLCVRKPSHITITMLEYPRMKLGKLWNALSRIRPYNLTGDYIMMGNDDLVFKSKGWDVLFEKEMENKDHPFYVSWFDDSINAGNHCAFPIVSKQWVAAMGFFVPEIFGFLYHDTWVFDVAKKAGVLNYIDHIKLDHEHFSKDRVLYDKTYATPRQNGCINSDKDIFESTENQRFEESAFITEKIKQYKLIQKSTKK